MVMVVMVVMLVMVVVVVVVVVIHRDEALNTRVVPYCCEELS
jgi:hypothetical protein